MTADAARWLRVLGLLAALGLAVIVAGALVDQLKTAVAHG